MGVRQEMNIIFEVLKNKSVLLFQLSADGFNNFYAFC
jgi:hypothetical protein